MVKILKTNIYCVGRFSKTALNKVIRNKEHLFDEDTYWRFRGSEVSGGNEDLGVTLNLKVKGGQWVVIPGEEITFYEACNIFVSQIRKVPRDTFSTMHKGNNLRICFAEVTEFIT